MVGSARAFIGCTLRVEYGSHPSEDGESIKIYNYYVKNNELLMILSKAVPVSYSPHPDPLPAGEGIYPPSPLGRRAGDEGMRLNGGDQK
jgi:hypothetical protein